MMCLASNVVFLKSQRQTAHFLSVRREDHSQRQSYSFSATETKIFRKRSGTKSDIFNEVK